MNFCRSSVQQLAIILHLHVGKSLYAHSKGKKHWQPLQVVFRIGFVMKIMDGIMEMVTIDDVHANTLLKSNCPIRVGLSDY